MNGEVEKVSPGVETVSDSPQVIYWFICATDRSLVRNGPCHFVMREVVTVGMTFPHGNGNNLDLSILFCLLLLLFQTLEHTFMLHLRFSSYFMIH